MRVLVLGGVPNLAYTVQRIMALLRKVVLVLINVPALNKWTQIFPTIAETTVGFVHQFVPVGLARSLKKKDSGDPDPPELLNMPLEQVFAAPAHDEQLVWQKEKGFRQNKACRFLCNPLALVLCIIWLCASAPVLQLHYSFFKRAKQHYIEHDKQGRRARAQMLIDLCSKTRSKARAMLSELESMLNPESPTHRQRWRLLFAYAGNNWGPMVTLKCRNCVLILIGNIWRRLVFAFECWPWPLVQLLDPTLSYGDKLAVATLFCLLPCCCLDHGVGRRLRTKVRSSKDLLAEDLLEFLEEFFCRISLANQYVECLFAGYMQWINKSNKPLSIWNLARSHIARQNMKFHQHCVASRNHKSVLKRSAKCRPVWVKSKRRKGQAPKRVTGLHLFASRKMLKLQKAAHNNGVATGSAYFKSNALIAVDRAWKALPKEEKNKCTQQAGRIRTIRKYAEDPLDTFIQELEQLHIQGVQGLGPWGGDIDYPVSVRDMEGILADDATRGKIDTMSEKFVKQVGPTCAPTNDFPTTVTYLPPCLEKYTKCRDAIGQKAIKVIKDYNRDLGLILQILNKRFSAFSLTRPLIGMKNVHGGCFILQVLSFRLNPVAAELVADWKVQDDANPVHACPLTIHQVFPMKVIFENDFWLQVFEKYPHRTSSDWEFEQLIYEPNPKINNLYINERNILDLNALREELGHTHKQVAALKALKRSLLHWAQIARTKMGAPLRNSRLREVKGFEVNLGIQDAAM